MIAIDGVTRSDLLIAFLTGLGAFISAFLGARKK